MKVLHLVESLERGGLERVVVDLALAQQAAGHDVSACCLFRRGQLAAELSTEGIVVSCAEKQAGLDTQALWRVYREIRRTDADVLHTHNAVANYYGALASLARPGVRLVNTRHGMGSADAASLKERLFRMSLLRTAAVAMVCERAKDHFVSRSMVPRRLAHVVLNGIRVEKFTTQARASKGAVRAGLGLPQDAFVIGTVGRLNWAKDQALLVDSFARFHERTPAARLVIIGAGELRAALEEQISGLGIGAHILLLGDRSDVPDLLPAFDIFAATSVTEGYSIAFLEAAAAALPVVASDVGGNREIVQHGVTGLVVGDRSAEAFAEAFASLADDCALRGRMSAEARSWALQHASLGAMVSAYEKVYSPDASIRPLRRTAA